MDKHSIVKAKLDHENLYTIADQPMDVTMSATLNSDQLDLIKNSRAGHVIPISQVVDHYSDVEDSLKKKLAFNYSLEDHSKLPLNFLLLDASISDIQNPDNRGGILGGSLALPQMYAINMPIDDISPCGAYKKILDYDAPVHYVMGQAHSFAHSLRHHNDSTYPLLARHSRINPQLIFPDGKIRGSGGVPPPKYADLAKTAVLHGHLIDNESMYPEGSFSTVSEEYAITSDGKSKSYHVVALPEKSWPRQWYRDIESRNHDLGALVDLEEYASDAYNFLDKYHASRCTNFDKCGVWWNFKPNKEDAKKELRVKFNFRIIPIVPKHSEGKEMIPHRNYMKHLSKVIHTTSKPFNK